jgi:undecaprenyl-diphosphatase
MLSYFQAIILGAVQGITELFPISSLGHSVILPSILGWKINQNDNFFLIFLVATHLATALVLFGFFFKDWVLIIKGIFRSLKMRVIDQTDTYAKLGWLLIIGSIPAGILGLLFQDKLKILFASPKAVAVFLILNGFMLYGAELLKRKKSETQNIHSDEQIAKISWMQGIKVGLAQCLALIPGFSRTGSTIGGGLLIGLNHEDAARFSFLLATPIILAAAVLELPELFTTSNINIIGPILTGFIVAGVAAYFSISFLTKYFKTKKLTPFAVYCVLVGIGTSLLFLFR